jgi:hypothetical protein
MSENKRTIKLNGQDLSGIGHTAILRTAEGKYRYFRESDNVPVSPIFTNQVAAVDFPKHNALLSDEEWLSGEIEIAEENLIIGPNG